MEKSINLLTENHIVDAVSKINFSGNVIPESWYHTIVNNSGKVNLLSINILSDIVYWYRPTEVRDELTGNVSYVKKFRDDELLQRSYEQLCEKFNVSTKQAREALIVLEQLGVVKRVFKTISTAGGACPNVMFLELFPETLLRLTFPKNDSDDVFPEDNTSSPEGKDVFIKKETPLSENVNTNTKTTTEINTEISTTTMVAEETPVDVDVVQQTKELFSEYNFSDDDISALVDEAYGDFDKIQNAYYCLKQQHSTITNAVGWLRKAIRRGYIPKYTPDQEAKSVKNSFNNFSQRNYDWDALEKKLLGH